MAAHDLKAATERCAVGIVLLVALLVSTPAPAAADDQPVPSARPQSLNHTVNYLSLTAPGSHDLIVVSYPDFYNHLSVGRYYFFAALTPPTSFADYVPIEVTRQLADTEPLADIAQSSAEYMSAVDDANCVIQKLFVFEAGPQFPSAIVVVMQNATQNLSGNPKNGPIPPRPTHLLKLRLEEFPTPYSKPVRFEVAGEMTLDRFYCLDDDHQGNNLLPIITELALKK